MKKVLVKKITKVNDKVAAILEQKELSKSAQMKALFDLGLEIKEISDLLSKKYGTTVRYNFVYNVVSNYVLANGIEVAKERTNAKKDQVVDLLQKGLSVKEIVVELKVNTNYVYKIRKEYNESLVAVNEVVETK